MDEAEVFTNTPCGKPAAMLSKFSVNGEVVSSIPSQLLPPPLGVTLVVLRIVNSFVLPKNLPKPIQPLSSVGKLSLANVAEEEVNNAIFPDASVSVLLPE